MVFSSEVFLFAFLPSVLVLSLLVPGIRAKNVVLVVASAIFYAWGAGRFVALVLVSAVLNYAFGRALGALPGGPTRARRAVLALAVAVDLGILIAFKYAAFFAASFAAATHGAAALFGTAMAPLVLPLGISFFTFHAISYVVDVYRRTVEARRDPVAILLYFTFFPQLIAGPIVRYKDIAAQLGERAVTVAGFAWGARRFVVGLGKKVLIANTLGACVDAVFAAPPGESSRALLWFAMAAYTLQIYFDFSGYSDMAIGLARMFGFRFLENFDFPYVAGSMTAFWQRWHISLSRWFRDYLYIPLGGNRGGAAATYRNLIVVFLLCGFLHGANWTFVVWGALHGTLLILERIGALRFLTGTPILRHAYALSAIVLTFLVFRSESLGYAAAYLRGLVVPGTAPRLHFWSTVTHETAIAFALGCLFATPLVARFVAARAERSSGPVRATFGVGLIPATLVAIVVMATMKIAAGTYNPFIYFRF